LPVTERRGAKSREVLGNVTRGYVSGYAHADTIVLEVDDLGLPPPGPFALGSTRGAFVVLENVRLGGELTVARPLEHEGV
jgi:hypothetical protein